MTVKAYVQALETALEKNADAQKAAKMEAYMRHQFQFYGLSSPERKRVSRPFLSVAQRPSIDQLPEVIELLWEKNQREFQMIGMELLNRYVKILDPSFFMVLKRMITKKSWWDTVDYIASNPLGSLILRFSKKGYEIIDQWRKQENKWLLRSCLLFQLKYGASTDKKLLFDLVREQAHHSDFFIRKAIGWALRQYAKTNPGEVRQFVDSTSLSPLSRKEALKHF